ncbi:MAG: hypothetical protein Q7J78_00845, partial [Clostridiales bacterium]|nr:hypothetical protein [Clostridiales bacterium]
EDRVENRIEDGIMDRIKDGIKDGIKDRIMDIGSDLEYFKVTARAEAIRMKLDLNTAIKNRRIG